MFTMMDHDRQALQTIMLQTGPTILVRIFDIQQGGCQLVCVSSNILTTDPLTACFLHRAPSQQQPWQNV